MNIMYLSTISNTNKYVKIINLEDILNVVKTIKQELNLLKVLLRDSLYLNKS